MNRRTQKKSCALLCKLRAFSVKLLVNWGTRCSCACLSDCSEEEEEVAPKANGGSKGHHQLGSSLTEKIGISVVDDDVGIVFKVRIHNPADMW